MRVRNARLIGMPSDPHHFHDHADTVYAKAVKELLAIFGPPLTHSRQPDRLTSKRTSHYSAHDLP
jgi:hypothetical protein